MKTIRIWYFLFHLIDECRKNAAKDKLVSGMIPIAEGKNMQIWAEIIKRGEKYEPCFRGQVINLNNASK